MKHKPTYQQGLSREDIHVYRNGSEPVRRKVEGAVSDGFDQDALDGWQAIPGGTSSMRDIDKRFRMRPARTPYYIGAGILTIAIVAGILLFREPDGSSGTIQQAQPVQLSVEQSDVVITPSIDSLEALPQEQQLQIATLKTTQQELQQQPEAIPTTSVNEIPEIILKPLTLPEPKTDLTISKQRTAKEVYFHDLKLVDYRQYRTNPVVETERIVLSGTPADMELNTEEASAPMVETVSIPYIDYLEKTMRYVSRGKWKQSLQRLQLVIAIYPDDLNAHFYAGLCSYNLQQYGDAKQHFATCMQLPFSNFNEEAAWYLAQSLLANGEKNSAKEVFTAIRDQKGYYAKQADKVLKGMK